MNKKYVVYQDKYVTGYKVYDPSDPESSKPNEFDVVEQFDVEEDAKWFGYLNETIKIKKEDIEYEGYTVEQLEKMSTTELYNAVFECLPDPEKEFSDWGNGANIIECDEDKKNEAYDVIDDGDWVVVTVDVKYKFTMWDGEVKSERVKKRKITLREATDEQIALHIWNRPDLWCIEGIVGDRDFQVYVDKYDEDEAITVHLFDIWKRPRPYFATDIGYIKGEVLIEFEYLDFDAEIEFNEKWEKEKEN